MKLSTVIETLSRTLELVGDRNIRKINVDGNMIDNHRIETAIMIDPVHDNQKGIAIDFSNVSKENAGLQLHESILTRWDKEEG